MFKILYCNLVALNGLKDYWSNTDYLNYINQLVEHLCFQKSEETLWNYKDTENRKHLNKNNSNKNIKCYHESK